MLMFTKWVFVPVVLAALGFFVLGPILEGKNAAAAPSPTAPPADTPRFNSEPDVEVSVAPATRRRTTTTRAEPAPPTRRRSTPAPAPSTVEPPPVPEPEPTDDHGVPPPTTTIDGG